MIRIRKMMLMFVGALMVSSVTATGASAVVPEFEKAEPFLFTSTGTQVPTIEVKGGDTIVCSSSKMTGGTLFAGVAGEAGKFTLRLKKCENSKKIECETAGKEITSEELAGTLGYLLGAVGGDKVVTLAVKPELAAFIAKFECGAGNPYEVKGCVIGTLSPANQAFTQEEFLTLIFKQSAKATQELTDYERPLGAEVNTCKGIEVKEGAGAFVQSGLSMEGEIALQNCPGMEKIKD